MLYCHIPEHLPVLPAGGPALPRPPAPAQADPQALPRPGQHSTGRSNLLTGVMQVVEQTESGGPGLQVSDELFLLEGVADSQESPRSPYRWVGRLVLSGGRLTGWLV